MPGAADTTPRRAKAEAWPLWQEVSHWRAEARRFRIEAADAYVPSVRQHIDLAVIYRRALRIMPDQIDGQPPLPVPEACPATLNELLGGDAA